MRVGFITSFGIPSTNGTVLFHSIHGIPASFTKSLVYRVGAIALASYTQPPLKNISAKATDCSPCNVPRPLPLEIALMQCFVFQDFINSKLNQ